MKVTKLRAGYRISCTDADFAVLSSFASQFEAGTQDTNGWTPFEKAAYTKRTRAGAPFLRVDEDKRERPDAEQAAA